MRHLILLSCCSMLLAGCITPDIRNWPDTIPSQGVFVDIYSEDGPNQALQSQTEYLEWTLSFYQGNLAYQSGWLDIDSNVLDAPDDVQREELMGQLRELGIAIGSEWAKHNDVRKIDTRMLSLWGSTIQLAPDFETQKQTVEVIAQDVALLLIGDLSNEEVTDARYAELLGIELFDGF